MSVHNLPDSQLADFVIARLFEREKELAYSPAHRMNCDYVLHKKPNRRFDVPCDCNEVRYAKADTEALRKLVEIFRYSLDHRLRVVLLILAESFV